MSVSDRVRREIFFVLLLLSVIFMLYLGVFGQDRYRKLREYRRQSETLNGENDRLRRENEKLTRTTRQLKSDPNAIAKVAREDFNFASPGDIIVTLPDKETGR